MNQLVERLDSQGQRIRILERCFRDLAQRSKFNFGLDLVQWILISYLLWRSLHA